MVPKWNFGFSQQSMRSKQSSRRERPLGRCRTAASPSVLAVLLTLAFPVAPHPILADSAANFVHIPTNSPVMRMVSLQMRSVGIRSSSAQKPLLFLRGGSDELGLSLRSNAAIELQAVVPALMSTDNTARTDAEARFNALKQESPDVISAALLQLVSVPQEEDRRAFAAVLASRTFPELWPRLATKTKDAVKQQLLVRLQTESVSQVARKVANIISSLSVDCRDGLWPDLLPTVFALCSSEDASKREISLHTLALLPQQIYRELKGQIIKLKDVLSQALSDQEGKIQMAGIRAYVSYLQACDTTKEMRSLQGLLPQMLKCIGDALVTNEELARTGLEALVDLSELDTRFLKPYLTEIAGAMQQHVAMNDKLDSSTRELGLEILISLAQKAPKMMKKVEHFVPQVVAVCLALMVQGLPSTNECESWIKWADGGDEDEEETGCYSAAQEGLDRLAIALGGSSMVPASFHYIPNFVKRADDWRYRLVGLMAISQTAEGSRKEMKKHLKDILDLVLPRVADDHPRVRWAAVNCLGQLCSDFGPVLQADHHGDLMPPLIARMDPSVEACLRVRAHAAAAVINFCEHAEPKVLDGYLQPMLAQLASLMQADHRQAREQAVTTVATVAMTVGKGFDPFYPSFMPFLKTLLISAVSPEERKLRGKVLECISLVGGAVGRDRFRTDARETMDLLIRTQQEPLAADDPQLPFVHMACGRICRCLGAEFVAYLPSVLPSLLRSASINAELNLDEEELGDSDWNDIEVREVGETTVGIRTSALDEKQTACEMLVTYLNELRGAFFPFLETTAKTMLPLLQFSVHEDIRACAADAMPALCRCAAAHVKDTGGDPAIVQRALDILYPAVREALSAEPDQTVQGHLARALGQMVDACNPAAVSPAALQDTAAALKLLLDEAGERVENLVEGSEGDDEDEDPVDAEERARSEDEALEVEEELIEQIAFAVGKLILTQGDAFLHHADVLLPWFLDKLSPASPATLQRLSMAMIDDVIEYAGERASRYVATLLPLMMTHSLSPDVELRQAALYGIGLCAEHGGAAFRPLLSEAQIRLETAIAEADARSADKESATDNAVASLGKLALFHGDALLVEERRRVWASWLGYLPLRGDVSEAQLVHRQLCRLVQANHADLLGTANANLPRILRVLGEVLETDLVDEEGAAEARRIVQQAHAGLGDEAFEELLVGVPPELVQRIRRAVKEPAQPALQAAA